MCRGETHPQTTPVLHSNTLHRPSDGIGCSQRHWGDLIGIGAFTEALGYFQKYCGVRRHIGALRGFEFLLEILECFQRYLGALSIGGCSQDVGVCSEALGCSQEHGASAVLGCSQSYAQRH